MAGKLNVMKVKAAREPGRYVDGDGLMLLVKPSGARSWVFRMQVRGKRHDFGLGSERDVSLAEAREKASDYRRKLKAGVDPAEVKRGNEADEALTFAEAARRVHTERAPGWKNPKHAAQWLTTLERYAFPLFGDQRVDTVGSGAILRCVQPIWLEKPETARRVKQRIGTVLDWAHAHGMREDMAPLRAVDAALKKQKRRDNHFAAIPYTDLPNLMQRLEQSGGMGALALRFTILTAARSGETRGARWSEIDLKERTWTVPAERMKADEEHVVALSEAAVAVLEQARFVSSGQPGDLVFPGQHLRPLSDMTMSKALKTAGAGLYTVHGMRSAFRDWAAERTDYSGDVVEAALAHKVRNKVEAAYRRTKFLEKRRPLVEEWAEFVSMQERA